MLFRNLKHEQANYETFKPQDEAKLSVFDYLAFYKRSHSTLGYQSPCECEREYFKNAG
ncbi:IS3 family transposase [Methylomonas sp.]|jgi:transposase InsO family protein|uniref:IS3 family transposase n=1 Tax=Methylomonas sp. TaxID=418 RepID=UPI003443FD53